MNMFYDKKSVYSPEPREFMLKVSLFFPLKDLEETIGTMKEQIVILKSRADILQEELKAFTKTWHYIEYVCHLLTSTW